MIAPIPVVVIRPEPGNAATCQAITDAGLKAVASPLFRAVPRDWALPEGRFAGLLVGSAAVFAHGGPQLRTLREVPVHAVGEATARAAQAAGFAVAAIGSGGLQAIADTLAPGRYLRLAGEAHVPLSLPAGVSVIDRIVYAVETLPLAEQIAVRLRDNPALVLLHSAEAARHWCAECDRLNLPRHALHIAALAPRIASAAGPNWKSVGIAPFPRDDALLSLARQMCQTV